MGGANVRATAYLVGMNAYGLPLVGLVRLFERRGF